jgi:ABC-type transport system involved in multi-copper enzyme maturation permease subunit
MIWLLAKKEFLEKILDFRVIISFIIGISLMIISIMVSIEDYKGKKSAYDDAITSAQNEIKEIKIYSQYEPRIIHPPSVLSIFCKGIDINTPLVVKINLDQVPRYEGSESVNNPFMEMYESLDIITVLKILFSLLVILLTYDLLSGEKENGTLRLIMSNSISRIQLLFGKLIGILMIIAMVTIITFLLGILLIQLIFNVPLSSHDYFKLFLIFLMTLVFLSFFSILGAFTSIKFKHSSTSLIILLIIWFVVTITFPNLNIYLASEFSKIPNPDDIKPALEETKEPFFAELKKINNEYETIRADKSKICNGSVISIDNMKYITYVSDADYDFLILMKKQIEPFRKLIECSNNEWQIYKNLYLDKLDEQLRFKRILDIISPASLFTHSASVIAGTDIDNYEIIYEMARQYRNKYIEYLHGKGIFSNNSQLYFSQIKNEDIDPVKTIERFAGYRQGKPYPRLDKLPSLDLSDAPVFNFQVSIIFNEVKNIIGDLIIQLIYCLLFLSLIIRSIHKYDVR